MKVTSLLFCIQRNVRRSKLISSIIFLIALWFCVKQIRSYYDVRTENNGVSDGISLSSAFTDILSNNIYIHYQVIQNEIKNHMGVITFTNTGTVPIPLKSVTIYFSSMRKLKTSSGKHFKISHINGLLHKIEPVSDSVQIAPRQSIRLEYIGIYSIACRTLIMPNWYFVGPNGAVGLISNTVGEQLSFVGDFKTPDQWKPYPDEKYNPYTPEQRYDIIGFDAPAGEDTALVVPEPLYVFDLNKKKNMRIDESWRIYTEKGLENEAKILKGHFQIEKELTSVEGGAKSIILKTGDPGLVTEKEKVTSDEAYVLTVNTADQFIEVIGQSPAAVFYGIQTLLSLTDEKGGVPMVTVKDAPRFEYRGMHFDVSRNFHSKTSIFRLLEAMSMYKLNKFHFHLTDDEAWRLEIPGLPELTTIGSKRCHDPSGLRCIQPHLGADPRGPTTPTHYTVQDYQEILQYANDRHIEVIPEIDMPGHCHAAIKSMEARYRILTSRGETQEAEEFLLTEFDDTTEYVSVQQYHDNTLNPCLESTYRFMSHVIKALVRMHKDIQPLKTYHLGGDEVPRKVWEKSLSCEKLVPATEYEEKRQKIKEYFVQRTMDLIASLGLTVAGWDDFFAEEKMIDIDENNDELNIEEIKINVHPLPTEKGTKKQIIALSWNDADPKKGIKKAYLLAQEGYKVVLAHASHLYFDHPYEPDPEEHGNFWATRFTDTRKVFGYVPNFCYKGGFCGDLEKSQNILGITGALWSETVRTADQLDFMIFPRLLALAERAWRKAPWEDIRDTVKIEKLKTEEWKKFSSFIVKHELERLETMGIKYRLPPPGARFNGNKLMVRTALPGLPVQFSKDAGKTWHDVTNDTQIDSNVILVTRSLDRLRMSRPIELRQKNG